MILQARGIIGQESINVFLIMISYAAKRTSMKMIDNKYIERKEINYL